MDNKITSKSIYHPPTLPGGTSPRQHKLFKSSSLMELLSNSYNSKHFQKQEENYQISQHGSKLNSICLERFKKHSYKGVNNNKAENPELMEQGVGSLGKYDDMLTLEHNQHSAGDLGAKAMNTLSRSLGKLWWKRSQSIDISTPDPEYKVSYLGNVLTGWAKGEGSLEKQLNTLWRNYTQNSKSDVIMRVKISASGLKAITRQHGLTEYWANRITHCCTPKNYPRIFCWIYRHEGRKLKHELRCHAVLCNKQKVAHDICIALKDNLESALREFKREKIHKQNARLSLANAAYDNPSLPRRKILLSVGGNNYRLPLERSKSAPKLMAIEEAIGEENGEIEDTNEPEMMPCCQKDSLYPAMTLGRRRCRRGHSIRRTGNGLPIFCSNYVEQNKSQCHNYSLDHSDDFDKLLKNNKYKTSVVISNELLPYFDLQLHKNSTNLDELRHLKNEKEIIISGNRKAYYSPHNMLYERVHEGLPMRSPFRNGIYSNSEEDMSNIDAIYFHKAALFNLLHRHSLREIANISISNEMTSSSFASQYQKKIQSCVYSNDLSASVCGSIEHASIGKQNSLNPESNGESISSGCEPSNQDDTFYYSQIGRTELNQHILSCSEYFSQLKRKDRCGTNHNVNIQEHLMAKEIYQRSESQHHERYNNEVTTFISANSMALKIEHSSATAQNELNNTNWKMGTHINSTGTTSNMRPTRRKTNLCTSDDSDSQCSDESGYVEFQERDKRT